jgi:phenylpropionate dioxygenase-like ring-hydroxylating dioxygenase large terminal subunit
MEPIDGNYGLLVDNLMDLSHEAYLHGGYIGIPEVAETPMTTEVDEGAGIVRVSRHMDDAACPPFYSRSTAETDIVEGEADHRDSVLTAEEQATGEAMMICVSRCRGARLVLDL